MKHEIELEVKIKGDLNVVMRDLLRLREAGTERTASITALIFRPPNQRYREPFSFPAINEGDAELAMTQLDRLVQQRLVTEEQERQLDEAIKALGAWTRAK